MKRSSARLVLGIIALAASLFPLVRAEALDECDRKPAGLEIKFKDNGTGLTWGFCVPRSKFTKAVENRPHFMLGRGEAVGYRFSCGPGYREGSDCVYTERGFFPFFALPDGETDIKVGVCGKLPPPQCPSDAKGPRWEAPFCRLENGAKAPPAWNTVNLGSFKESVSISAQDERGPFEFFSDGMQKAVGICMPVPASKKTAAPEAAGTTGGRAASSQPGKAAATAISPIRGNTGVAALAGGAGSASKGAGTDPSIQQPVTATATISPAPTLTAPPTWTNPGGITQSGSWDITADG